MMDKPMMPKHPEMEMAMKMSPLEEALSNKDRMSKIRTKYGRPNPKDVVVPKIQWENDDHS